ncbi:uncharacterized protein LOC121256249 isoform X2 [Juglans microcarpa x Juglans regia]|uniref:uncharacterized protein LOC121256249 isoform X2 n=1 Tax=Juglans microcarpa x Juglans regia TaxID=2249226 RepID=UPI001B7EB49B|nr:uncharacterized protein LOC121256249 isoform X2 [Juglans microcarpa x Juglans regia]
MEGAEEELERRSKFLNGLIQKKKAIEQQEQHDRMNVRVRACDMPLPLQNCAFRCARDQLDSMPGKLDSKRLALALKKVAITRTFSTRYFFGQWNLTLHMVQLGTAS